MFDKYKKCCNEIVIHDMMCEEQPVLTRYIMMDNLKAYIQQQLSVLSSLKQNLKIRIHGCLFWMAVTNHFSGTMHTG